MDVNLDKLQLEQGWKDLLDKFHKQKFFGRWDYGIGYSTYDKWVDAISAFKIDPWNIPQEYRTIEMLLLYKLTWMN